MLHVSSSLIFDLSLLLLPLMFMNYSSTRCMREVLGKYKVCNHYIPNKINSWGRAIMNLIIAYLKVGHIYGMTCISSVRIIYDRIVQIARSVLLSSVCITVLTSCQHNGVNTNRNQLYRLSRSSLSVSRCRTLVWYLLTYLLDASQFF